MRKTLTGESGTTLAVSMGITAAFLLWMPDLVLSIHLWAPEAFMIAGILMIGGTTTIIATFVAFGIIVLVIERVIIACGGKPIEVEGPYRPDVLGLNPAAGSNKTGSTTTSPRT